MPLFAVGRSCTCFRGLLMWPLPFRRVYVLCASSQVKITNTDISWDYRERPPFLFFLRAISIIYCIFGLSFSSLVFFFIFYSKRLSLNFCWRVARAAHHLNWSFRIPFCAASLYFPRVSQRWKQLALKQRENRIKCLQVKFPFSFFFDLKEMCSIKSNHSWL